MWQCCSLGRCCPAMVRFWVAYMLLRAGANKDSSLCHSNRHSNCSGFQKAIIWLQIILHPIAFQPMLISMNGNPYIPSFKFCTVLFAIKWFVPIYPFPSKAHFHLLSKHQWVQDWNCFLCQPFISALDGFGDTWGFFFFYTFWLCVAT